MRRHRVDVRGRRALTTEILDKISSPADLADMSYEELDQLAFELRAHMIAVTSLRGGHLASSLGAVEIVLALHRVLSCPDDRIVFDVGHQAYAHKLLTGRKEQFKTLRTFKGISGFPKIDESPYDAHDSGHASDALSTAFGYCVARDLNGTDQTIAAVVGDASFTGGMSMEALNSIGNSGTRLIVVLNDNGMSISPNIGGFAAYLAKIRTSSAYINTRDQVEEAFNSGGKLGRMLMRGGNMVKASVKQFVLPGTTFLEGFGVTYLGPIDGHDIPTLEAILREAKELDGPVIIHAVTKKGKGYAPAEENPGLFHGVGPFDISSGVPAAKSGDPSWTSVFGDELVKLADENEDIVAITAAMEDGTGLKKFAQTWPERFYDVGIAEEHAVCMASSLAMAGKLPVVAIYSTFLQRAFDQVMINVALQKQHVVFAIDRAGLVGADGPTHHGAFDLSYLRAVPGMKIMAPSNDRELRRALRDALALDGPVAIRYARGSAPVSDQTPDPWEPGQGVCVREGADVALLAVGDMVPLALDIAARLHDQGVEALVYDMRWVKPVDDAAAARASTCKAVFTFEDNSVVGGFGTAVLESLATQGLSARVERIGLPDGFVEQGSVAELFSELGLDAETLANRVLEVLAS